MPEWAVLVESSMSVAGVIPAFMPSAQHRAGLAVPAVVEVGVLAREALRYANAGSVVAVFDRSFYAVLRHRWICVGTQDLGSGPLHVLCERRPLCWPKVGDAVAVTGAFLHIADRPFAKFDDAEIWLPKTVQPWTLQSLGAGLDEVDRVWRVDAQDQSLAAAGLSEAAQPPSLIMRAATPGLDALNRVVGDLLAERAPSATDAATIGELVGLGPGLTPSGDDLLSGALIALASLDLLEVRDVLWRVCADHLARTNDISRAHLRSAAQGYGAAALHVAIGAVMIGAGDRIETAIGAVSSIGHSSGRDAFAGALMVLRAVKRHLAAGRRSASVSGLL